jgi:peptidoglycan/xylan/chitin deacetylase (PgdA/CDA1 family)
MAAAAGALLGVQYLPSVLTLGTFGGPEALGSTCRWRGPGDQPEVALTFDDGPDPRATPATLDELDRLGLTATFFVVGEQVEENTDLVAEIARRGHRVAAHGQRHRHHLALTPPAVAADLEAVRRTLAGVGSPPRFYRPTYGQLTASTLFAARRQGWELVLWSAWGREWATDDPAEVAARVESQLRPGAIVLLHDSDRYGRPGMADVARQALPLVAQALERRGLSAVTLDRLVDRPA